MIEHRIKKYISFDDFSTFCVERGYTPKEDIKDGNYYVKLKNSSLTKNVKVELSERPLTGVPGSKMLVIVIPTFLLKTGVDFNWDQINAIETSLFNNGITILRNKGKSGNPMLVLKYNSIDDFFKAADTLENLTELVKQYRDSRKNDDPNNPLGFIYDNTDIVNAYGHMYDVILSSVNRGVTTSLYRKNQGILDILREEITIGRSTLLDDECEKQDEHLIPCDYQIKHYVKMIKDGKTEQEVIAEMMYANKIITLRKEQSVHLDSKAVGLKISMPPGWKWGDSVTARLDHAGIDYQLNEGIHIEKWKMNPLFDF
jgi:hypothetical protein